MSEFYDRMSATALRLIERFGIELVLKRIGSTDYDPVTGDEVVAEQSQTIKAVVGKVSSSALSAFGDGLMDGALVSSNLRVLTIAAEGMAWPPEPEDKVEYAGHDWSVVGSTPSEPGGQALVYKVTIRR